jgi:uncharacterized Zn-finger protein
MNNFTLPSIDNLPLQNLCVLNLPPLKYTQESSKYFYCRTCPKKFSRKNSLLRHMRVHADVKPFSCKFCCKSFSRKDILVRHRDSLRCIKNVEAFSSKKSEIGTESRPYHAHSQLLGQSIMSISSLVTDTSDLISDEEEHTSFNYYTFYSVDSNELELPSRLTKYGY